jgi:glycosyltransferase involved in cell wall biosynthesis
MKTNNNKFIYIHNADFSNFSANKIQVINMCNSISKISSVELLTFGNKKLDKDYLQNIYGTKINFKVNLKRHYKLHYLLRSILLVIFFICHLLKSKINSNRRNKLRWSNQIVIYTRDIVVAIILSLLRFKVIYELHDVQKNVIWHKLIKLLNTFSNTLIVTVNSNNINYLKEDHLITNIKNIYVIPNGVDLEKFNIDITKEKAREMLNLPKNKVIITYTGSLKEWKGYKTILESCKLLENENKNNKDILFLIVGGQKEQIEQLKKEYPECKDKVLFIPFVDNSKIPLFLKASDILVIPNSSKYEISVKYTSPLKLFEYMASKRPILASDLPSIREIISEKEALFFEPDNPHDFVLKLKELISNEKLREELAKNAYEKVKDYTWDNRAKRVVEIVEKEFGGK